MQPDFSKRFTVLIVTFIIVFLPGAAPAQTDAPSSPLQFKIGDATITPIGFMDLTNTYRSTNAGTSLQTNFGSIPYNNTVQGHLTEDKFSAANSRIGFRVDTECCRSLSAGSSRRSCCDTCSSGP